MRKYLFICSALFLLSCGPSAEEQAKIQKAREDSIRVATQQMMEKKAVLQQDITDAESQMEGAKNRLALLVADLEVQKDKLNTIKQPQFLRTPAEREQHIRDQVLVIQNAEESISETKTRIEELDKKITAFKKQLNSYNQ